MLDKPVQIVKVTASTLSFRDIEIHPAYRQVFKAGNEIHLNYGEYSMPYCLAKSPGRVFTRDQLLDEVWGFEYYGDSRTIDVHIKRLRLKLEGVSDKWALKTVWGVGYKFECDEERS